MSALPQSSDTPTRFRLTIEYDGAPFFGWQVQKNGPSVQGAIADAVAKLTGTRVIPRGAGRTDSGVHALGQVAHLDLTKPYDANTVREALNHYLKPNPISILDVREMDQSFDARFSALARHYRYRILNRRPPATFDAALVWWVSRPLDVAAMNEAAQLLVGTHDFTTFRSTDCQSKSPIKTLASLTVKQVGREIHVETSARSFMHAQVRSMVGSLKLVGEEKWSAQDLTAALEATKRTACGPVAPARGLYFVKVDYPAEFAE